MVYEVNMQIGVIAASVRKTEPGRDVISQWCTCRVSIRIASHPEALKSDHELVMDLFALSDLYAICKLFFCDTHFCVFQLVSLNRDSALRDQSAQFTFARSDSTRKQQVKNCDRIVFQVVLRNDPTRYWSVVVSGQAKKQRL